jgi:hypothetical protein
MLPTLLQTPDLPRQPETCGGRYVPVIDREATELDVLLDPMLRSAICAIRPTGGGCMHEVHRAPGQLRCHEQATSLIAASPDLQVPCRTLMPRRSPCQWPGGAPGNLSRWLPVCHPKQQSLLSYSSQYSNCEDGCACQAGRPKALELHNAFETWLAKNFTRSAGEAALTYDALTAASAACGVCTAQTTH